MSSSASASTRPPWQATFLSDLQTRDRREKALDDIISAYGALAERLHQAQSSTVQVPPSPSTGAAPLATSAGSGTLNARSGTPANDELSRLRSDFALAQQQQSSLTAQVKTLTASNETLKSQLATATARLETTEKERLRLERRCKDLTDEARIKDRQFQNVQDEMLAQEMELNMVLQREQEVKKDNQMLLDRWMALKRTEAEEMNRVSQWE
ncbi:autophagy protein 16 [Wilcoxina mikolae CBS 423.85]|nr:autophagy protein 16 [Wilcoxina mikolae CBS 423.85]